MQGLQLGMSDSLTSWGPQEWWALKMETASAGRNMIMVTSPYEIENKCIDRLH
jgi:hypothetical protein